ncbi:DUF695 domain-containing protein [Chitinimonas arctica]|nr:DUF695 domain-containing protein [Chitinimonas arctica]
MAWLTSIRQHADRITHVLIDDRFAGNPPAEALPCLNWFAIWFAETPPANALIAAQEEAAFEQVQRSLVDLAQQHADGWAVYGLRVMSYGIAEYYFYSRDESTLAGVQVELERAHPGYRIEHASKVDASWAVYKKFLPPS